MLFRSTMKLNIHPISELQLEELHLGAEEKDEKSTDQKRKLLAMNGSQKHPGLSDCVEIKEEAARGRFGVAKRWLFNPLLHGTLISVNGNSEFWIYNIFSQGNSGWGGPSQRKCNSRQAKSRSDNPSLRILPQVICNGKPISTCREVGRGGYLDMLNILA